MVRGSHLLGALPHETTYDDSSMLKRGQQIITTIDEEEVFGIDLKPGQASIHHTEPIYSIGVRYRFHALFKKVAIHNFMFK